ncbi:MAG: adenylate/guanylate cyclase domain-containing protein [Bacteroidetes bacterium MedPE-SWsnd-G2]|nr:MAG: adenylate/guanylate cyclase domain-containing protein [Bacteroidetes bacterium MedPE-SWsnd-G2]
MFTRSFKYGLFITIQSVLFWVIASGLIVIFRYYGLEEEEAFEYSPLYNVSLMEWADVVVYTGISFGLVYASVELLYEKYLGKKWSLGLIALSKSIIYLIFLITVMSFVTIELEERMDIDIANDVGWWRQSKFFWVAVLYASISSLIFTFIKMAIDKFGRGVFVKMLFGVYRKPQEEERIFMFLDLKDSTSIAESLGHLKYSQFIQQCFSDLNAIVNKYDAEIYQYVGDEAVLSWPIKRGLKKCNCIELFFAFETLIGKKKSRYLNKFGRVPKFKAGVHGGKLMIAEVGVVKKELAYHGDVINTTARIQALCNSLNASLLLSKYVWDKLEVSNKFEVHDSDIVELRGKKERLEIVSVLQK